MRKWSFAPRRIFIAGLLVTLPGVIAAWVLWLAFSTLDGILEPLVKEVTGRRIPGLSFLALVSSVFLIGLFASNLLGARIVRAVSSGLERVPLFSPLYRAVREVSQVFLGDRASAFRRVGLLEWPKPGAYAVVFVMAESSTSVENATGRPLVTVFLPTSPNPTTGFVQLVPPENLLPLDMSVEQALRLLVSAGAAHGVPPAPKVRRTSTEVPDLDAASGTPAAPAAGD